MIILKLIIIIFICYCIARYMTSQLEREIDYLKAQLNNREAIIYKKNKQIEFYKQQLSRRKHG